MASTFSLCHGIFFFGMSTCGETCVSKEYGNPDASGHALEMAGQLDATAAVLDMVDSMSSTMLRIPYAMVLLVEKGETILNITNVFIVRAAMACSMLSESLS